MRTGRILALFAHLAGMLCSANAVLAAEEYPARAITILVPFAEGGPTDTIARLVGNHMSRTLGQPIAIANVPGGGGTVGALRGKRASADGYTLLAGNMGTHAAAVALYPKLAYDPRVDFQPVGLLGSSPIVILARKDFPPKNLSEFMEYVQAHAQSLDEGNAGRGSVSFTACLLLNRLLGVTPRRIPHDGTRPAMDALLTDAIDFMCDQEMNAVSAVRSKRIKAYAIAAPERSVALPDVPTTGEAGLSSYQVAAWNALFTPVGTSQEVVETLNGAIRKAFEDPALRHSLLQLGCKIPPPEQRSPGALADLVRAEVDRWTTVIKTARPALGTVVRRAKRSGGSRISPPRKR
jgi:tripartite-type tricarboxylate transporter receptor subunit TctC